MRALRMARHLRLLPGRQLAVNLDQGLIGAGGEPVDLLVDGHDGIVRRERLEFEDLAFEVGNRLFEIEVVEHSPYCIWR